MKHHSSMTVKEAWDLSVSTAELTSFISAVEEYERAKMTLATAEERMRVARSKMGPLAVKLLKRLADAEDDKSCSTT